MDHQRRFPRGRSHVVALCVAVPLIVAPSAMALAAWSGQGAGGASGAATLMPRGLAPTGAVASSSVMVSWPAATMANGDAVAGYVINRYNAGSGAMATVGGGCSGIVTTTTCTEQSVPPGAWVYTDTPVQLSWTGAPSPDSARVVVRLT